MAASKAEGMVILGNDLLFLLLLILVHPRETLRDTSTSCALLQAPRPGGVEPAIIQDQLLRSTGSHALVQNQTQDLTVRGRGRVSFH